MLERGWVHCGWNRNKGGCRAPTPPHVHFHRFWPWNTRAWNGWVRGSRIHISRRRTQTLSLWLDLPPPPTPSCWCILIDPNNPPSVYLFWGPTLPLIRCWIGVERVVLLHDRHHKSHFTSVFFSSIKRMGAQVFVNINISNGGRCLEGLNRDFFYS
jgi:hypothetical protein